VDDIANGVWLFIRECFRRTNRLPQEDAVAEYYLHLANDHVTIHRESLESDVRTFVTNCMEEQSLQVKAFRESRGLGVLKEMVVRGRARCANEPGCE
jgi:hypothetical protein